jgi:hypothetical protein
LFKAAVWAVTGPLANIPLLGPNAPGTPPTFPQNNWTGLQGGGCPPECIDETVTVTASVGSVGIGKNVIGWFIKNANNIWQGVKSASGWIGRKAKDGLNWVRRRGAPAVDRSINIDPRQLQSKYKHAPDLGITGNWNKVNAAKFEQAIRDHVANPAVKVIEGTFNKLPGQRVTHFLDPKTGVNVIRKSGDFHSVWKLGPEQKWNVLNRGSL